ncbi:hypothetical protein SLEP1_g13873 [Rubroshorea leprosula]|uniref:Retrotransposon gag domain-containing protein n=1 Tax=Rubroshorea leprosula TaxID=152421 RepID=A0AAV5IHA0_9ROSI|nr:hypothetical protein SLEP1_g13873 [Rubroshorea leprosula]
MEAAAPIADHGYQPQHRKPYPDVIDHENPFPKGFKVPEFTLFSDEVGQSTIEHIGRFTIQCREASGDDTLKLKLFPSSLTGTALTWYLNLPQNSVYSWRQMEDLFPTQFYRCEPEVSMADLLRLAQKPGESSEAFLAASHGTYYSDPNFDLDVAYETLYKAKETMGVDADPFPAMSVGMNVADLKSVARNRSLPYAQRNLTAEDLRWVIEAQRSRHSRSIRPDQQRVGGQGRIIVTRNFSPEGARRHSTGIRSPRMVKPPLRSLSRQWEKKEELIVCEFPEQTEEDVIIVPTQNNEEEDMADKIVFEKPEEKMARHIRPLYINAHMDRTPINRVLVDNGAAVVVLPTCMLYKIGKFFDDLVHTKIHSSWCVPSTLHQKLIFWNGGKAGVMSTDDKPFLANTHLVEARYYEEDIGTIRFFGMDRHGKPIRITACSRPSLSKHVVEEGDEITLEKLDLAPDKLDDLKDEVQDPLEEINLGSESEPKVTFINGSLESQTRDQIVKLLHEFKDCFAWDYSEMPATPKDEYPMPIADLLVDGVAHHKISSFMDD